MYRFLLQPRWLGGHLALLAVVAACVTLGGWQWDRHEQRSGRNAAVEANASLEPVALREVLGRDESVTPQTQWRPVTARGRYDADGTVLIRNRSRGGAKGFEVLVPLVTGDGTALLVDRGWVPAAGPASARVDVPEPPVGPVTVTGRLRAGEQASERDRRQAVDGDPPSLVRIDLPTIAASSGRPLEGGYVELLAERPAPAEAPVPPEEPEVDGGPNLAYSLQWYFFAMAGVVGYAVLIRREAQDRVPAEHEPAEV